MLDSNIGFPHYNDANNRNKCIEKISYNAKSKQIFINQSLCFENVESKVWEYKIGGYQVLDKYLKSHKGEEIDHEHFENIIKTLHKSLEIESKIAQIDIL